MECVQASPSFYTVGSLVGWGSVQVSQLIWGRVRLKFTSTLSVPLHQVACHSCQVESALGDRTMPGVTLGLPANPQSKSDSFCVTPGIGKMSHRVVRFSHLSFPPGCLVPRSLVDRVTHILASLFFSRIQLGLSPAALNTNIDRIPLGSDNPNYIFKYLSMFSFNN